MDLKSKINQGVAAQLNITVREASIAYAEATKAAKNIPEYKLLAKKYRTPKGYEDYQNVATELARHCYFFRECPEYLNEKERFAETMGATLSTFLAHRNAPVYWIASDLATAMLKTDLPRHVTEMARVVECGIFMLPIGILKTPDGESVSHLCFHHMCDGDAPPMVTSGKHTFIMKPVLNKIICFTTTRCGITYAATTALEMNENGKLRTGDWNPSPSSILTPNPKEVEENFLQRLNRIVIQTLLYMQVKPESVELGNMVGFASRTQRSAGGVGKQQSSHLLNPNWIGKEYRLPSLRSSPQGTHSSPDTHWRRGFWRNQPVGEGRAERKWAWIQPTLVNG